MTDNTQDLRTRSESQLIEYVTRMQKERDVAVAVVAAQQEVLRAADQFIQHSGGTYVVDRSRDATVTYDFNAMVLHDAHSDYIKALAKLGPRSSQ